MIGSVLRAILVVVFSYSLLWGIFYVVNAEEQPIPLGTDVRFDDWCATITKIERPETIGDKSPDGQFVVLYITMTNKAKGIAQKPSDPRIHIIDHQGHKWAYSEDGQRALESVYGKQIPLDQRLELHQSLNTMLVFDIPKNATDSEVYIEEGPSITKLLFPEPKKVFLLP
jgi:hypothetical protein